jgi:hypothetical protein
MLSSICFAFALSFLISDTTTKATGDSKVIIIPDGGHTYREAPEVFVKSGSADIIGSPEANLKAAFRTWEQACDSWEKKMSRLNGKNLMSTNCGEPHEATRTHQSETTYSYKSKGTYEIRVIGK